MKRVIIVLALVFGLVFQSQAQKFAYIDSDYVLRHVPAYTEALAELNRLSAQWQEDIETKYDNIATLEEAYAAEKILLTSDMKSKREGEIAMRKSEAREMQKQKFGVGGELFQMREELINPIQEDIYEAIDDVASSKGYMVIFDTANNNNMLFTNEKYNVSDQVIRKMGLTPGETFEVPEPGGDDKGGGEKGGDSKGGSGGKSGASGRDSKSAAPAKGK